MDTKHRNLLLVGIFIILSSILIFSYYSNLSEKTDYTDIQTTANKIDNKNIITEEIFIKGSDTILPVSLAETNAYMQLHPEKKVSVIGGGSSLGVASFIEGEVEIAMASRKIKESELENAASNNIEPTEIIIAWDGISVIVNKDNSVENVTIEQLKRVYTGEVTNWKTLGGNDEEINVLIRDSSSGTYGFFKEHVLDNKEYSESATTEPNTEAVVKTVASDRTSIGYIGLAYADDTVKTIGLRTSEGTFYPEKDAILKGSYPLSRPLQYYTNGNPEGTVGEYIEFVLSEQGQSIVSEVGYLPVN